MCGIWAVFRNYRQEPMVGHKMAALASSANISHRGEDATCSVHSPEKDMVFHRLAINGLTTGGNQPFTLNNEVWMMINGEIYNHRELEERHNLHQGHSDCEVVLHLYRKIGFEATVKQLDGVFAIVLFDETTGKVFLARDPYGVRGMVYQYNDSELAVCSEIKGLVTHGSEPILEVPCGSILTTDLTKPELTVTIERYFDHAFPMPRLACDQGKRTLLMELFETAVKKRLMCDRPHAIGSYLSGGLDSSLVAALAQRELQKQGLTLKTYSIGFKGSPDLKWARVVADHIGSIHKEFVVTEEEMLECIPDVVYTVETWDTTTIRASCFMWMLTKKIYESEDKTVVLFSGEGSDEASGSYMYFHAAPSDEAFHEETNRLLKELHYFDCRRADRCSAAFNKEVRLPFLDLDFLSAYRIIHPAVKTSSGHEKFFLRSCVEERWPTLLPKEVLWRPKEAMSDGVSTHEDSWFSKIQRYVSTNLLADGDTGLECEKNYYRLLFNEFFDGHEFTIPHYWEPKWLNVKDPSARLLNCYRQ